VIAYSPVMGSPRRGLGQITSFTGGITDTIAKKIVSDAEPVTRQVIIEERNRLAGAMIGGIPFFSLAAIAFAATQYLVRDDATVPKFIGYAAAAAAAGGGAFWTLSKMQQVPPPQPPSSAPAEVIQIAVQTAQAIVNDAEPLVRQIISEERVRAIDATKVGIPFWAASAVAFAATAFMVKDGENLMKTAGYSISAILASMGAYAALDKERG